MSQQKKKAYTCDQPDNEVVEKVGGGFRYVKLVDYLYQHVLYLVVRRDKT